MDEEEIESWLEDQIEEIINVPQYHEHKSEMASEAAELKANAELAGISLSQLKSACEGDIEAYLLRKQNAFTDAEIARKTAKD